MHMGLFEIFKKKQKAAEKPKSLGQLGEEWAQEEYKKSGYSIVATNEYNKKGKRVGEIDFIATDKTSIAFVEVKTRTKGVDTYGRGVESVDAHKQRKLLYAVKMYLGQNFKYQNLRPHIDVCSIEVSNIDKLDYSATIFMNSVEDWN